MEGMKVCSRCGIEKPVSEMSVEKRNISGIGSWCKKCKAESSNKYHEINRGKVLESNKNNIKNLVDSYIIQQLVMSGIDKIDITSKMIRRKRKVILKNRKKRVHNQKIMDNGKRKCCGCGKIKPFNSKNFTVDNTSKYGTSKKYGLKLTCRKCTKKRLMKNKEIYTENKKLANKENPERRKMWSKKSYQNNKDNILAYQGKYYEENKDGIVKEYRKNNEKHMKKISKEYRDNHKEEIKMHNDKRIAELPDSYIRSALYRLDITRDQITPGLIIAKRAQIKLYRAINSVC